MPTSMVRSSHSPLLLTITAHRCFKNDASSIKRRDDAGIAPRHSISKICTKETLISDQRPMPDRVNQFCFANCLEKKVDQAWRTLWSHEPIHLRPNYDSFLTAPRHAMRCAHKGTVDRRRK